MNMSKIKSSVVTVPIAQNDMSWLKKKYGVTSKDIETKIYVQIATLWYVINILHESGVGLYFFFWGGALIYKSDGISSFIRLATQSTQHSSFMGARRNLLVHPKDKLE